ncbi:MAG: hypothetical protein V1775_03660 [Bacteroidota bacterium]
MGNIFTFREITEKDELEQAFRLRYNAYKDTDLKIFLSDNGYGIDISHFDLHSKILGIFLNDELIATNRLCVERKSFFNEKVLQVGQHYGYFRDSDHTYDQSFANYDEYPFLSFPSSAANIKCYYEDLKSTATLIAECGRFAILSQYRSVRVLKFMFDCMFVFGIPMFGNQKRVVVTETMARHTSVYKTYGFKEIAVFNTDGLEQSGSLLSLTIDATLSNVPEKLHANFQSQLEELKKTGKIDREI